MELLTAPVFNTLLGNLVIMLLAILLPGIIIKRLRQPYVVAYIIAGMILGPYCFKVFSDPQTVSGIGEFGVIIQMFFIGTKMEIHNMNYQVKKPLIAVFAQLLLGLILTLVIGFFYHWSATEIFIYTCIISLSSSAIIFEYLEKNNELKSNLGFFTRGCLKKAASFSFCECIYILYKIKSNF